MFFVCGFLVVFFLTNVSLVAFSSRSLVKIHRGVCAPTLAAESGVDELPRCGPCSSHLCQHWGRDTGGIISPTDVAPPLTTTSEWQCLCVGDTETD